MFQTAGDVPVKLFWTGHAHDQPILRWLGHGNLVAKIDKIITVSRWQAQMLSRHFKFPLDFFFISTNGFDPTHYRDTTFKQRENRLVYTSAPYRGLVELLEVFPQIRERVPDAELQVMAGGRPSDGMGELAGKLGPLTEQPGVSVTGGLPQPEMAAVLCQSKVFAYPNTYPETSCIAAIEAQAAGLPVVTSALGGLVETAEGQILLSEHPRSKEYEEKFVDSVVRLLSDDSLWRKYSRAGRERVHRIYPWPVVAGQWNEFLKNVSSRKKAPPGRARRKFRMRLAEFLISAGRFREAFDEIRKHLKADADDAGTFYQAGLLAERIREAKRAKEMYERTVELKPDLYPAHIRLGEMAVDEGDLARSEACFAKAVEIQPTNQTALSSYAAVREKSGNPVSFEPADIVFYTEGRSFSGDTLRTSALEGSER